MKKVILSLLLPLILGQVYGQDVSISVTNAPSVEFNETLPVVVTICNQDLNSVDVPANRLRQQLSVSSNVEIISVTNSDGTALTDFQLLSMTPGSANTVSLLLTSSLPGGECKSFHAVIKGKQISDIIMPINATLSFVGPQTPGNITGNDTSQSEISVFDGEHSVYPFAGDDMIQTCTLNTPVSIPVVNNDHQGSPGMPSIDVTSIRLIDPVDASQLRRDTVVVPGKGMFTIFKDPTYGVATGIVEFKPQPGFLGGSVSANYVISDGEGNESNVALVNIDYCLPVTLISFNATREGNLSQLNWATAEETNSDRFEIQRSTNAKNWTVIGSVASNGESKTLRQYTFTDKAPLNGQNLYRLKMIDRDETFAFSSVISLKLAKPQTDLSVYPNPASQELMISDSDQISSLTITDLNGRPMVVAGQPLEGKVNVSRLKTGTYLVRIVRKDGAIITKRILRR